MKKIYFLFLLCCLSLSGYAQTTVTIWATGASGSYTTGRATSTGTRGDNAIRAGGTPTNERGYAVFDLSSIPAGSFVTSVVAGFYINGIVLGTTGVCSTNVYAGDLSLVTVPATLYSNMAAPPSTNVSTASYGAAIGSITQPTSAAAEAAVSAGAGGKISYVWTHTGSTIYIITGETGSTSLSTPHAPYLTITYCPGPTGMSATASPTTLCDGQNLTLTGAATGATIYRWDGPGGYTSTALNPPAFATSLASAGVYTLTASLVCGTYTVSATATTAAVTVNPLPAAISGATSVCVGGATTLSSSSGGNWTSSNTSVATIGSTTGTVVGVAAGTATMTYTFSTGCYVTYPMTVNDPPTAISGPTTVCEASTITLTNGVPGGTWTSSATGVATVGAGSGVVTGVSGGMVTITYTPGGCTYATHDVSVSPLPSPIVGPNNVCVGSTIGLTDATSGGTWSSSNITRALVSTGGVVTGVSAGAVTISYTSPVTGCSAIKAIVVNNLPAAIAGPTAVCQLATINLTDATPGGTFSGGAPNASVTAGGIVTGINVGGATITYTVALTGCFVTTVIVVDPAPAPIAGPTNVCEGATVTLTDPDPGGVWTSANTTRATVGSSSGIVTGISAPGTNISYTLPSGCSINIPMVVNAAPTATITPAGATTFCIGGSVVLDAPSGAGLTYQWNNSSGPIAGETNMSYTATTTSGYTVDVTNSLGCTATSAPQNVTAGIIAIVNNATPLNFCIGGSVTLIANTGAATGTFTYQWQKDGLDIPGGVFVSYPATTSGVYRAVVTVSGGSGSCLDTSDAVTVAVNPLPTPPIFYSGTVLSTSSTYGSYQWYRNTVAIPGANSFTYTPVTNGAYIVRVSDGIGCSGFSNSVPITGVGVAEITTPGVKVYPNPAANVVHIESHVIVKAVITGVEGRTLLSVDRAHDLDVSHLPGGLYIIRLYDDNGTMVLVQKLIKE